MSDFKKKEFANIYTCMESRIKTALGGIEDIRYSLSEIVDEFS